MKASDQQHILQPINTGSRRSLRWDRTGLPEHQEKEKAAPDVVRGVHPRQMYYPRDWVGIELEETSRVHGTRLRMGRPQWLHDQMHRSISEGLEGVTGYAVVESQQHSSLPMGLVLVSARGRWYVLLLSLPSGERVWVQEGRAVVAPAPPLLERRESGEYPPKTHAARLELPEHPLLGRGRRPERTKNAAVHTSSVSLPQRPLAQVYIEDLHTRTIKWSGYLLVSRKQSSSAKQLRRLEGSPWVVNEVLMHAWAMLNLGSSECHGVSDIEVYRLPSGVLLFGAASYCTTTTPDVPYVESELITLLLSSSDSEHASLSTKEGQYENIHD